MNKVIITGGNGLVGSRIVELLSEKYEFDKASRETGINIAARQDVLNFFKGSSADWVIHLAAKADVDGCELDKSSDLNKIGQKNFDWENSQSAYGVNVYGTKNVIPAANETNKKIIYISTDFVFSGEKEEPYSEEDVPNPINWYASTKYLGEEDVKKNAKKYIIARIAYPYRPAFPKKDFVRAIIGRFESGQEVLAVKDHIMTPTFIDDIANALDKLIENDSSGIFHVVGASYVSPLEIARKISEAFNFDKRKISETTRKQFFLGRAPRPFHLALRNDKIAKLGTRMKTFDQGLLEVKNNL